MKKILVTGGAGFIGYNLCSALLSRGDYVACLDNFSTGFRHNIAPFADRPNFKLTEGDIRNLDTCNRVVADVYIFVGVENSTLQHAIKFVNYYY